MKPGMAQRQQAEWSGDADPDDQPTYPMRRLSPGQPRGMEWERPALQVATVEVLHSNERPNLSAAFGTAVPPRGLSGAIRRFAFRYSESSWYHWLPLMLADRVNVIEGLLSDLLHLHIPNIPAEMGARAELRHNPMGFAIKAAITLLIMGGIVYWIVS